MPASELHAEVLAESLPSADSNEDATDLQDVMGDNRLTIDDSTRQALTMEEIDQLKQADTGSGKDIIAKIMQSHSGLHEKTAFALSKYTMRKRQKYLKRFTCLPLDVSMLTQWMLEEKEPARIMEVREEMLGLIASWANIHYSELEPGLEHLEPNGRWLVVDDTAGLVVAAMAERMGILYPREKSSTAEPEDEPENEPVPHHNGNSSVGQDTMEVDTNAQAETLDQNSRQQQIGDPMEMSINAQTETPDQHDEQQDIDDPPKQPKTPRKKPKRYPPDAMSARNNSLTLLHPATQPNISMLSYFSYDPSDTNAKNTAIPAADHPLHTHLKTVNFLQLTQPEFDGAYQEPESFTEEEIKQWKSSQRGNYFRKRRRWERVKRVVDEARAGGFDGLVVASTIEPATILNKTVPLLKGGAQIAVYSPNIEPLAELADLYSSARRTAYLNVLAEEDEPPQLPNEDFPVDPRLLLAATVQTARARAWQVLPGRTHPMMTSRGGAEGYLFTATKVIPAEGRVQARGNFAKKRKDAETGPANESVAKKPKKEPED